MNLESMSSNHSTKKISEDHILFMNRFNSFVHQINSLLIRSENQDSLMKIFCNTAVNSGVFCFVSIGWVDRTKEKIKMSHFAGLTELYFLENISLSETTEDPAPPVIALKERNFIILNDIETEFSATQWKTETLKNGFKSCIAIPLVKLKKSIGVIQLYAPFKNRFDETVGTVISELTNNINFVLEKIEKDIYLNRIEDNHFKSEKRYEMISKISPVGIFHTDLNGYTNYVNPSWCQITGITLFHPNTMSWIQTVHTDDRKELLNEWEKLRETQKPFMSEFRFVRPDGNNIWVMAQLVPEQNSENLVIGYIGTITDITAIKNAQRRLSDYKFALDQSAFVDVSDKHGTIQYVNENFCRISGYSSDELINKSHKILNSGYHGKEVFKDLWDTILSGRVWKHEIRNKTKSGSFFWTDTTIVPFLDENGKPIQFITIRSDITALKKAQEELIMERDLSDAIISNLPGVFFLCNQQGEFLRWNLMFEESSVYSIEEIQRMHPTDFFEDGEREKIAIAFHDVFMDGEGIIQAIANTKTRGKIPFHIRGKTVKYNGSDCLLGVATDLSDLVKAQEIIKQNAEEMRQLASHLQNAKEDERKRIAREIHDDLGQLLTAIKMSVSWIDKEMTDENKKIKEKLKYTLSLINSGNQTIRRILEELRPHLLENCGLAEALKSHGKNFTANTNLRLVFTLDDMPANLSGKISETIFRIFQEVLTNIARYAQATEVFILLKKEEKLILFSIEDNGIGFDPTKIDYKKSFGITGIKERVYALDGTFELISEFESGTKIVITVPFAQIA